MGLWVVALVTIAAVDIPSVPWVLIPGSIVVVPLDDTRSVHSTLSIRCEPKAGDGPAGRSVR